MDETKPAARSLKNEWAALLLLGGGAAYVLLIPYLPELQTGLLACPWHRLTGMSCPGCGLTRACLALAHFDGASALLHNPLILLVAPYALYRLGLTLVALAARRPLRPTWPRWWVDRIECAFVGMWCLLAGVRALTFFLPHLNPQGWLMP